MLSRHQVDHFRTFGFLVLRDFLGAERTEALRAEVDATIRDAYVSTYDERVMEGISGHYVPMTSRFTPVSASLVCDDSLFIDAAAELLGVPVLPSLPEGVLYFEEAGWHDEDGIGVKGVKFATYFDELVGENGALRFVPCSHLSEDRRLLRAYQFAHYGDFPGVVVDSHPGDVIAFDFHTFHASFGGRDRLAWTIEYLAEPENGECRERTLRWMTDAFEQSGRGFDRERYPAWRDWLTEAAENPLRSTVVERLQASGVLELSGARLGS